MEPSDKTSIPSSMKVAGTTPSYMQYDGKEGGIGPAAGGVVPGGSGGFVQRPKVDDEVVKRIVAERLAGANRIGDPPLKKRKKVADSSSKPKDKPGRPLSAYNFFFREQRVVFLARREKLKQAGHKEESSLFASMAKSIAAAWKSLPKDELQKYKDMAAKDLKRYKEEKDSYQHGIKGKARKATVSSKKQKKAPIAGEPRALPVPKPNILQEPRVNNDASSEIEGLARNKDLSVLNKDLSVLNKDLSVLKNQQMSMLAGAAGNFPGTSSSTPDHTLLGQNSESFRASARGQPFEMNQAAKLGSMDAPPSQSLAGSISLAAGRIPQDLLSQQQQLQGDLLGSDHLRDMGRIGNMEDMPLGGGGLFQRGMRPDLAQEEVARLVRAGEAVNSLWPGHSAPGSDFIQNHLDRDQLGAARFSSVLPMQGLAGSSSLAASGQSLAMGMQPADDQLLGGQRRGAFELDRLMRSQENMQRGRLGANPASSYEASLMGLPSMADSRLNSIHAEADQQQHLQGLLGMGQTEQALQLRGQAQSAAGNRFFGFQSLAQGGGGDAVGNSLLNQHFRDPSVLMAQQGLQGAQDQGMPQNNGLGMDFSAFQGRF